MKVPAGKLTLAAIRRLASSTALCRPRPCTLKVTAYATLAAIVLNVIALFRQIETCHLAQRNRSIWTRDQQVAELFRPVA